MAHVLHEDWFKWTKLQKVCAVAQTLNTGCNMSMSFAVL
jgi:hypothetical protein